MFVARAAGSQFAGSGMNKNGTQSLSGTSSSWVQLTSWTADTTNFPGSTLSGDALVVQGTKTGATVSATIPYTGSGVFFQSPGFQVRLKQNGSVIATGTAVNTLSGTATASATVNVATSDTVTVEANCNAAFSTSRTVSSGTGTWVRVS